MAKINLAIVKFMQGFNPCKTATLDMGATLIETQKKGALYCYKKFQAYQPLNTWWAEQQVMIHAEFRDGNVPAGYEQKRMLEESLSMLPKTVKEVRLRSDTAGYQWSLLKFCQQENKKGGRKIHFAIGNAVTNAFREEVLKVGDEEWRPIYYLRHKGTKYEEAVDSGQQWVEVGFTPSEVVNEPESRCYRFIAVRESMQNELPGTEEPTLPFSTYKTKKGRYKLFGIVTNIEPLKDDKEPEAKRGQVGVFNGDEMWGESIIHWYRERCGRSEQAHSILKTDLGGGKLPSSKFGSNAAWWWIWAHHRTLH